MNWWDDYIGLPFLSKGRDRNGVDCWGLLRLVYQEELGIYHPSYTENYEVAAISDEVTEAFNLGLDSSWQKVDKVREFDAVMLTISGKPFHCGVITTKGYMLHIIKGSNAVVESYMNRHWNRRIDGIYRYNK